jgi:hemoglobin
MSQSGMSESVYERVGGLDFFRRLVDSFYDHVAADPVLLAIYPPPAPADLGPARERLTLFLVQYWGGPTTYSDQRGHPRLRMRHAPFIISDAERDAWLRHMSAALDSLVDDHDVHPVVEARLLDYFTATADAMVNTR